MSLRYNIPEHILHLGHVGHDIFNEDEGDRVIHAAFSLGSKHFLVACVSLVENNLQTQD